MTEGAHVEETARSYDQDGEHAMDETRFSVMMHAEHCLCQNHRKIQTIRRYRPQRLSFGERNRFVFELFGKAGVFGVCSARRGQTDSYILL